jgi:hypothetical protein
MTFRDNACVSASAVLPTMGLSRGWIDPRQWSPSHFLEQRQLDCVSYKVAGRTWQMTATYSFSLFSFRLISGLTTDTANPREPATAWPERRYNVLHTSPAAGQVPRTARGRAERGGKAQGAGRPVGLARLLRGCMHPGLRRVPLLPVHVLLFAELLTESAVQHWPRVSEMESVWHRGSSEATEAGLVLEDGKKHSWTTGEVHLPSQNA